MRGVQRGRGLIFELLTSQAVGVLRATMLVPNLRRFARLAR